MRGKNGKKMCREVLQVFSLNSVQGGLVCGSVLRYTHTDFLHDPLGVDVGPTLDVEVSHRSEFRSRDPKGLEDDSVTRS